jgi:peptide/nickel transport system substrate-binding protein
MDREEVIKTVLRGHGALGNNHPITPSNPFHNKDLPQRAYDPGKRVAI